MRSELHAVHGGRSLEAVGSDFRDLHRRGDVVAADVLDAWYPPAPTVLEALQNHLEWLVKTSPPTHADGLVSAIAAHRGIPEDCVLPGPGTSGLLFEAFPLWLRPSSTVLLLDPTYSEYPHLCSRVVGCQVIRHELRQENDFRPDLDQLRKQAAESDWTVLVNPNSPTGVPIPREALEALLDAMPEDRMLWVDETYVDFAPPGTSLEELAGRDPRIAVAKSMSKFYALSGLRVGYVAAHPAWIAELEVRCPPWNVGMMGQLAAIEALRAGEYYRHRAGETHQLREELARRLAAIPGVTVFPSVANFLLLSVAGVPSDRVVARCSGEGVYLRDCASLGMGDRFVRATVQTAEGNDRIVAALQAAATDH